MTLPSDELHWTGPFVKTLSGPDGWWRSGWLLGEGGWVCLLGEGGGGGLDHVRGSERVFGNTRGHTNFCAVSLGRGKLIVPT